MKLKSLDIYINSNKTPDYIDLCEASFNSTNLTFSLLEENKTLSIELIKTGYYVFSFVCNKDFILENYLSFIKRSNIIVFSKINILEKTINETQKKVILSFFNFNFLDKNFLFLSAVNTKLEKIGVDGDFGTFTFYDLNLSFFTELEYIEKNSLDEIKITDTLFFDNKKHIYFESSDDEMFLCYLLFFEENFKLFFLELYTDIDLKTIQPKLNKDKYRLFKINKPNTTYEIKVNKSYFNIEEDITQNTDLQDSLSLKEDIANKNQANGYVGLDGNAKIDISHMPNSALERLIIVADEVARFALTTTIAQNGDVVKQQDTDTMFYIVDDTNLNNASGYEEFAVGTAGAVEWSNILNKPIDIFHTGTNTTDDITEGNTNLFDKEVVFTGGNNVKITGIYPNFEIQDNTMSQIDIQNALDAKLNSADNLTDVANQQTALNNITAVSGATDEYVLTKDTATGNATWKVSSDELIKVSANDTTAGYLEDKIVGATNKITVTTLDDSSNEDLQIDIGTDIFDKSINTMDDVADGTTYVKTENNLTDILKTNYNSAYTHSTTTTGNPHNVTKKDVGLENVVNVDTTNPENIMWTESYRTVTDTEKTTWNAKVNSSDIVTTATANKILKLDANAKLPTSITGNADGNSATATKLQTIRTINGVSFDGSADITIQAVDSTSRIASSEKGAVNGVATLDNAGRVPSSQLPSYVAPYIIKSKSSTYTALITDDCIFCTNTWTLSLPVANTWTKPLTVKNIGTGIITIDANGSQTIDGELTIILTEKMYAVLMSDGTNIYRIGG